MNNEEYLKSVVKESVVEALNELFGSRKKKNHKKVQHKTMLIDIQECAAN